MPAHLPPLNALRAFVAAARHCSFRLAAEELHVTPGAISRQIRLLEEVLGVPLFDRSRRQVALTPPGARYFTRMAELFTGIAQATEDIRGEDGPRAVHVDSIPTFAMHWLLPRLPLFKQRFPGVEVTLTTSVGRIDLTRRFDYAIRRDAGHFAGLTPRPLMAELSAPVCRPGCDGGLASPADLAGQTIITIRARTDLWPAWCTAQGLDPSGFRHRLEVDHTFFAIQAAEEGLGVAVVPLLFVERPLAAGRLVTPLGPGGVVRTGHYALLTGRNAVHDGGTEFLGWLVEQAAHGFAEKEEA